MPTPAEYESTLEGVRARFDEVAHEVALALSALTARVNELSDIERPPLASVLLDFQSLHLRLKRHVDQMPDDDEGVVPALEQDIRYELDLRTCIAAFASKSGLIRPAIPAEPGYAAQANGSPYDFGAAIERLQTSVGGYAGSHSSAWQGVPGQSLPHDVHDPGYPPPGYYAYPPHAPVYYIAPPPWQQRPPVSRDATESEEAPDEKRRPKRRRKADRESDGRSFLVTVRNFGGLTMMGAAVIAGGMALADRTYLRQADRFIPLTESSQAHDIVATSERTGRLEGRIPVEPANTGWQATTEAVSSRSARVTERAPAPSVTQAPRDGDRGTGQSLRVQVVPKAAPAPVLEPAKLPPPPPPPVVKSTVIASVAPVARAPAAKPQPLPEPEPIDEAGALFVPVLSTHKDAKAAREAFAELQKAHPAVLGAQQSEVQSSGGESGTWYRLVVTPAMSKVAATDMCSRLRAAGYGRCWVKGY